MGETNKDKAFYPPVPAFATALRCACPRCGQGKLYDGLLQPKKQCMACGLGYGFEDAGDGPAAFVMLIIGFVVIGSALWMEFSYSPPLWVHYIIWPPIIIVFGIWVLRVIKALLIILQYQHSAHEGQLDKGEGK